MKKLYNYNNLQYSLRIAELRLQLIEEMKYNNAETEKCTLKKYITKTKEIINYINKCITELQGTELLLFKKIIIDNYTITRAIEFVAETQYKDSQTIWKHHYKKIKPIINNLIESEEIWN